MHIVAHRIQCKFQQGYCVENPAEDFISIEEVMKYTGVTKSVAKEARNKRKRDNNDDSDLTNDADDDTVQDNACYRNEHDDNRVHCLCKKRGSGDFCLAKLQQASPSATRYPNAMYWCCAKNTISRCDFWRLAEQESVGRSTSLDASNVVCSRCKRSGHYARACTVMTS